MKTFGLISTASLFAFMSIAAFGQSEAAPETFESVSVTLSTTQSPARAGVRIQGERVTGNRLTLEELLVFAHGVQRSQISGPNWISTERFDLVAKTETPVTYPRLRKMLQVLLEDLFKLMSHRETRAVPVYPGFPFWILASSILRSFSLEGKPFLTAGTHRAGPKCLHWTLSFSEGDHSSVGRQFCRHSSELHSAASRFRTRERPFYPLGSGSAQILCSMSPNSLRFRCPSANNNQ